MLELINRLPLWTDKSFAVVPTGTINTNGIELCIAECMPIGYVPVKGTEFYAHRDTYLRACVRALPNGCPTEYVWDDILVGYVRSQPVCRPEYVIHNV